MCVYIYIYTHVYIYTYIYTYTSLYVNACCVYMNISQIHGHIDVRRFSFCRRHRQLLILDASSKRVTHERNLHQIPSSKGSGFCPSSPRPAVPHHPEKQLVHILLYVSLFLALFVLLFPTQNSQPDASAYVRCFSPEAGGGGNNAYIMLY